MIFVVIGTCLLCAFCGFMWGKGLSDNEKK